ncbi:hypothetical protein B9K06_18355 [Bacillus sp. OG2]|nr:hypothetical protein B9K06_18355 [Bacillus sp. OG2]
MPRGFRDTWYDCKKASRVSQEVSGIHDITVRRLIMSPKKVSGVQEMAARRPVMYANSFPKYTKWLRKSQSCI